MNTPFRVLNLVDILVNKDVPESEQYQLVLLDVENIIIEVERASPKL